MASQEIYLCRHGETEWNLTDQHTSFTDLSLTDRGKEQARLLSLRLKGIAFEKVFVSPMQRSIDTCRLAGLSGKMVVDPDFLEWNYGEYEGVTTAEIRKKIPDWSVFLYGAPGGESIEEVEARAKRAVKKIRACRGNVAIFSHGHFTRVLGSVWVGLGASSGRLFTLSNASLSILGYERETSVFRVWNDTSHLKG